MRIKISPLFLVDLQGNIGDGATGPPDLDPGWRCTSSPISLTVWGRIRVPFTLQQGAEMSHAFYRHQAPEKQQPGASSMTHTHLAAETLPSPGKAKVGAAGETGAPQQGPGGSGGLPQGKQHSMYVLRRQDKLYVWRIVCKRWTGF